MSASSYPLIGIIIPTYGAQETLAATIASLLEQRYTNWEAAIASDDGVDYLSLLADRGISDRRLKQTFTPNYGSGAANARNAALQITTGEILATLDADDTYIPSRLELLVPLAIEHGAATDNTGVYNRDLVLYKRPLGDRDPHLTEVTFATADDILKPRIPFFSVFRREFIGQGWPNVAFAEGVLFNLELLSRVGKMALYPQSLYQYYKRENSTTQSDKAFETAQRGYEQILSLLNTGKLDLTPEIRRAAIDEFSQNLYLNYLFKQYMQEGRCENLEDFLDMTDNGNADWLQPELKAVPGLNI